MAVNIPGEQSEHATASENANVSVSESTHEPTSTTTASNVDSRVHDPDYVPDDDADDVETVQLDFTRPATRFYGLLAADGQNTQRNR